MTETRKSQQEVHGDKALEPDFGYASFRMPSRWRARMLRRGIRMRESFNPEIFVAVLAGVAALITYIAMSRKDDVIQVANSTTVRVMLMVNLIFILALGGMIARRIANVWVQRRQGAGSVLLSRVVAMFSAIAIAPPIIMAVFSAMFLEFGIESWFSDRIRASVYTSQEVAEEYLGEHYRRLETDIQGVSLQLERLPISSQSNEMVLTQIVNNALTIRGLSEVLIIRETEDGGGDVIARARILGLDSQTSVLVPSHVDRARTGETIVSPNYTDKTVYGLRRLSSYLEPTYVFLARDLSPQIMNYLQQTRDAVSDYQALENDRSDLLIQFNVVFIVLALLILFLAITVGINFTSRLVTPLSNLVTASELVGKGDLNVRVPAMGTADEVGTLSRAFNRMTDQLATQQNALMLANNELDDRRRFLEEVLAGVSAGVLGLNPAGEIFLPNRSALKLLGMTESALLGAKLIDLVPEMEEMLQKAEGAKSGTAQGPVELDAGKVKRTLLVRISLERAADQIAGYVVTFDDLTEQLADQRTAAWADVARRIAHEIKNPLTPIQLAAERLKRKYANEIISDPDVFDQCTGTIIRQVGDLRRMVDEFSSFARMPEPVFKDSDVLDVVRQAVFLQDVASTDISFSLDLPGVIRPMQCDDRLLGQAITNLIKNAVESVESRFANDRQLGGDIEPGRISVRMTQDDDATSIVIKDNGAGLPEGMRERLLEPYVTTRTKGTGLGLAIVRKIIEDHGGSIVLEDRKALGATATVKISHTLLAAKVGGESVQNGGTSSRHNSASAAE